MVTIDKSTFTLNKEGPGRFGVYRDGQRAGELLGRPGSWGAYDLSSKRLGAGASHGEAIKVLAGAKPSRAH